MITSPLSSTLQVQIRQFHIYVFYTNNNFFLHCIVLKGYRAIDQFTDVCLVGWSFHESVAGVDVVLIKKKLRLC